MNIPKVSIIMATYNRANFILETLYAIQRQTFENWECLIIDDGGTDNTQNVIEKVITEDQRFKYIKRNDNYLKGLPGCRNFGLDLAKGNYIIFFDDDDIPHPQNLELCVNELADEKIFFCRYVRNVFFGDFNYKFDYSKSYSSFFIDVSDIEKVITNEMQFNSCSVMWKKECFKNNRFEETLMYAEEWELYPRIISSGFYGISIEKCLFYGRKHDNSNTGEFYTNNPVRRKSYTDAILLVIKNLNDKNILSNYILRYFIVMSFNYKEFNLFNNIINLLNLSLIDKIKWQLFYNSLYVRLPIYRIRAKLKRKKQNNLVSINE